jgi:hypothetical protein
MNHISTKDLLSYVAGKLADDQCFEVETHLGGCPDCAKRARAHHYIRKNVDNLIDNWSATQHARELLFAKVYNDAPVDIKKKITSGINEFFDKLGAGLNVVIDATNKISDVTQTFLFEPKLTFSPALTPVRVLGDLADQPGTKTIEAENHTITVSPDPPKIFIIIKHAKPPYPLACIVPGKKEKETVFGDFRPITGEDSIIAEFVDIPSGKFTLLLENKEIKTDDTGVTF